MALHKSIAFITILIISLVSCNKEVNLSNNVKIIGTWISTDKSDTLDFVNGSEFYKSAIGFRNDHYKYHLDNDSIQIDYAGIRMPATVRTTHKYNLNGNNLTIDFTNKGCFGFEMNVMEYIKK